MAVFNVLARKILAGTPTRRSPRSTQTSHVAVAVAVDVGGSLDL